MPLYRSSQAVFPARTVRVRLLPALLAFGACMMAPLAGAVAIDPVEVVAIPAGAFTYQAAGEFLDHGRPVDAPHMQTQAQAKGRSARRRPRASKQRARTRPTDSTISASRSSRTSVTRSVRNR